jgi:glycine cleavage system regulatory protein
MATLILTVLGDDRPGLVSALSAPISAHGGSWERSQLARLVGKFAGIVLVAVPAEHADALAADLVALVGQGLQVTVERTDEPTDQPTKPSEQPADEPSDRPGEPVPLRLHLHLLGADHPGIVAEISTALAARGIGIEELSTDVRDAPMAGGTLFEARAVLAAPPTTSTEALRAALEELADELMVEIGLSDG